MAFISSPQIAFHGGYCCGIKTIWNLGQNPKEIACELKKDRDFDFDQDQSGDREDRNMYPQNAPEETWLERIDRYLKWLDAVRPNGIIEIALAQDDSEWCSDDQMGPWKDLLLERGFKIVTSCYNSNSGNRVHVFHRTTDKE